MPFDPKQQLQACLICDSQANIQTEAYSQIVKCARCGDFWIDSLSVGWWSCIKNEKTVALASHLIRKTQATAGLAIVDKDFLGTLSGRSLPTPIEAMDNLLLHIGAAIDGSPGRRLGFGFDCGEVISTIGVQSHRDLHWVVLSLKELGLVGGSIALNSVDLNLTVLGWQRYDLLVNAKISSRFAFFARRFANDELDEVFNKCLRPAVMATGYELRPVTQKAGTITAIIEDEIRRCRFLIADLSDDNNGAYWEAGFAEGLGKPVIYVCRDLDAKTGEPKKTHFDTDHRHTVRWSLNSLDETSKQLKAVIRNTLLGDAAQSDE